METETDVLIVGGGLGGVAGALAALRLGRRVVLTEETDWIGGQLTAQAVPPDEHPWIEEMGCTASYRRLREASATTIGATILSPPAPATETHLNPGDGLVSRLCHEPRVGPRRPRGNARPLPLRTPVARAASPSARRNRERTGSRQGRYPSR